MNESAGVIRYVIRNEINISKWDHLISNAPNGLIYAHSFYLDSMAENWSALILNDYEAVMPLTWNRKYGIFYLYQPYFTKALGVFAKDQTSIDVSSFLNAIPQKFKFWEIDLNENNYVLNALAFPKLRQVRRTNYILSLADDYDSIQRNYKRLAKRMKKKALQNNLSIVRTKDPHEVVELYKRDYMNRHRSIQEDVYKRLRQCLHLAFNAGLANSYLTKSDSGETLAYYTILKDDKFIYSLMGGSTSTGKESGAFYLITDAIIRDNSGTKKALRFEGSDIPGIAFFDSLFGPEKIFYAHIHLNKLPFPLNLFK